MNYAKIDVTRIGIKEPISVPQTKGNFRRCLVALRDLAQTDVDQIKREHESNSIEVDDDSFAVSMLDEIQKQLDHLDNMSDFVIKILHLKKKDVEKLDDLSADEMGEFVGEIASTVIGINSQEPTDADLKSNAQSICQ